MSEKSPYISDKAGAPGSSLYYAGLYEPTATRAIIHSLLTLHHEIFDCLTVSPDPGVTRIKLQWWHEELQRYFKGIPRHPLTTELARTTLQAEAIQPRLLRYIHAVDTIASGRTMTTLGDWEKTYFDGLGQIWSCLPERGTPDENMQLLLIRNGGAILTLEIMQNARLLLQKGYPLVPGDILDSHGIQAPDLNQPENRATSMAVFGELLDTIAGYLEVFESTLNSLHYTPPLYHLVLNRIALTLCQEIQADGCRLLEHRIALTPLRKLWITWKTRLLTQYI